MFLSKLSKLISKFSAQTRSRRNFLRGLGASVLAPLVTSWASVPRSAFGDEPSSSTLKVSGAVVTPSEESYEITRKSLTWQTRKSSHRPHMIVQPATIEDVIAAVKHARRHDLKIAVRSGGHSWVNSSIRSDSVLLDLGRFRGVYIDPAAKTAIAGPAITTRDFLRELAAHDLSFPVAHCGTPPLGGYLLGGGLGWNYQAWGGMACFCIRGIDVVTADGNLIYADENQNAELLWAARGGGPGFFGVVVRFYLQLFPRPKAVTLSTYSWPLEYVGEVGDWMSKNFEVVPDQVELQGFLLTNPKSPAGQCDANGKTCSVSAYSYYDTLEESREALAPLMNSVPASEHVTKNEMQPSSIEALIKALDETWLPARFEADTLWTDESLGKIGSLLKDHFACAPSPMSAVLFEPGRKNDRFPDAAFSMWAPSIGFLYAIWTDPKDDQENFDWVAKGMELITPIGKGHFISESNLLAGRAQGSYAPENWERLQALRGKYDPKGLFHTYLGETDVV